MVLFHISIRLTNNQEEAEDVVVASTTKIAMAEEVREEPVLAVRMTMPRRTNQVEATPPQTMEEIGDNYTMT